MAKKSIPTSSPQETLYDGTDLPLLTAFSPPLASTIDIGGTRVTQPSVSIPSQAEGRMIVVVMALVTYVTIPTGERLLGETSYIPHLRIPNLFLTVLK